MSRHTPVRSLLTCLLALLPACSGLQRATVVAHRGYSWVAPENTLASLKEAIRIGADVAEFDVRLTADRVPVLLHDPTVDRTTNGHGDIATLSLGDTAALDAGAWKGASWAGERIPTLEEALDVARGRLGLLVELKETPWPDELVEKTVAAIRARGMAGEVIVISFGTDVLAKVRAAAPELRCGLLVGHAPTDDQLALDVQMFGIAWPEVTPEVVRRVRAANRELYVWTVDDETEMANLDAQVDGITTNRPDLLLKLERKQQPKFVRRTEPLLAVRTKGR